MEEVLNLLPWGGSLGVAIKILLVLRKDLLDRIDSAGDAFRGIQTELAATRVEMAEQNAELRAIMLNLRHDINHHGDRLDRLEDRRIIK